MKRNRAFVGALPAFAVARHLASVLASFAALAALLACGAPDALTSISLDAAADDAANSPEVALGEDAAPLVKNDSASVPNPLPYPNAPGMCARTASDAVHNAFCGAAPADVRSLVGLENLLGFSADAIGQEALLSHSTALFGRLVTPINPRAILLGGFTDLAFHRGIQAVELASGDLVARQLNMYLVTFEQACNGSPGGCLPGDLFTPRIESGWTRVDIRDAEDLKDTPLDCRQCHQRQRDTSTVLMRELNGPWTHFFGTDHSFDPDASLLDSYPPCLAPAPCNFPSFPEAQGADLLDDYLRAKGDEGYAGMSSDAVRSTTGFLLERMVPAEQPLKFDGAKIQSERWPLGAGGGYPAVPQRSATWYAAYDAFKRGEELMLPYFAPRATDPTKQAALTDAYTRYRNGLIRAEDLPDLSDIYPDDTQARAEIGLQTEPNATPAQTLVQACGGCHNDVLDQTISRARFNIALSRMNRAEVDVAIGRLNAAPGSEGVMPPIVLRQLDPNGRQKLVDYLQQNVRSAADDALLEQAAHLGMAGAAPLGP